MEELPINVSLKKWVRGTTTVLTTWQRRNDTILARRHRETGRFSTTSVM
jgi:hypothetical protein